MKKCIFNPPQFWTGWRRIIKHSKGGGRKPPSVTQPVGRFELCAPVAGSVVFLVDCCNVTATVGTYCFRVATKSETIMPGEVEERVLTLSCL